MNLTWAAPDGGETECRIEGEGPDGDGDNRTAMRNGMPDKGRRL